MAANAANQIILLFFIDLFVCGFTSFIGVNWLSR